MLSSGRRGGRVSTLILTLIVFYAAWFELVRRLVDG